MRLSSALQKISNANIPMKNPNHATAHLYISNPFGLPAAITARVGGAGKKVASLFSTHPPVEDRIKALMSKEENQK